ncbi:MAG: 3-hydroxyacyl-ACP dehydratase FabZ family protein [Planctomycetaceae bacterium]
MADPLYPFSKFDLDKVLYDIDAIREVNPQRFEMEQLTAIVHIDEEVPGIVGYKDVGDDEFWVRGHMPDFALMPGVVQCEAAAQLGGFYARKFEIVGGDYLGFGGMNSVRFKKPVLPNSRLVLMAKLGRTRPGRLAMFEFQGYVESELVFSGEMLGVAIKRD